MQPWVCFKTLQQNKTHLWKHLHTFIIHVDSIQSEQKKQLFGVLNGKIHLMNCFFDKFSYDRSVTRRSDWGNKMKASCLDWEEQEVKSWVSMTNTSVAYSSLKTVQQTVYSDSQVKYITKIDSCFHYEILSHNYEIRISIVWDTISYYLMRYFLIIMRSWCHSYEIVSHNSEIRSQFFYLLNAMLFCNILIENSFFFKISIKSYLRREDSRYTPYKYLFSFINRQ